MNLVDLKAKRHALLGEMKVLNEKSGEEFEAEKYDALKKEVEALDAEIERKIEFLELEKKSAKLVVPAVTEDDTPVPPAGREDVVTVEHKRLDGKGEKFGALVLATMAANGGGMKGAHDFLVKRYGRRHEITKTLQAGSTPGSVLVPEDFANEVIELLRDQTVVRQLALRTIGLPQGQLTLPRQNSSATAQFIGENTAINATDMGFDSIQLSAKKLMSVTSLTSELLQDNVYGAEAMARDDLVQTMAQKEDEQLLRGTGSAIAPTSIKEIADGGSRVRNADDLSGAANQAAKVGLVRADLGFLEQKLMEDNIPGDCVWIMSPRSYIFLRDMLDGNGNKAFPEMNGGSLNGYRFYISNKIPNNLGAGTNESEIYMLAPGQFLFGDSMGIELKSTDTGSYQIGGNLVSTFATDSIAIRAISRFDFNARHDEAVYYLDQVKWIS